MKKGLSLFLTLMLLLCGCTYGKPAEEETGISLWFARDMSQWEESVTPWREGAGALGPVEYEGLMTVENLMAALLAGPAAGSGLMRAIPKGTRLLGWSRHGSVLRLDLSSPYDELVELDLTLADCSIALTLTQLDGVEGVLITVNGRELPYREHHVLRREDVVFSGAEEEPVELYAALHFRRAESGELGVELREFRLTENESAALAVLEALVSGPTDEGLVGIFPLGVEVYSARVENGTCYADFSQELLNCPVGDRVLLIRSISETLVSLGNIQSVQILVEGKPGMNS